MAELPPYRVGTQFVRMSVDLIGDMSTYAALTATGSFSRDKERPS